MSGLYKVSELFTSFEGEGKRAGELAFFIRLYGCNLDCVYCDTGYAHKLGYSFKELSDAQIIDEAKKSNCKNVTVTGGEPLIHDNIDVLIDKLCLEGFLVNIETNGSVDISKLKKHDNLFFTCDYKCPYSGMQDKMNLDNIKTLGKEDVLKFVVANSADLYAAQDIIQTYKPMCLIYLSPVFGVIEPSEIAEFMKSYSLTSRVRLQLQLHKYVYEPNKRGV